MVMGPVLQSGCLPVRMKGDCPNALPSCPNCSPDPKDPAPKLPNCGRFSGGLDDMMELLLELKGCAAGAPKPELLLGLPAA